MIYVTGDTHVPIDTSKLAVRKFSAQKRMTREDFVIICGDFGGVWDASKREEYWLGWFGKKNFTTLFVDGNHENHDRLDLMPIEMWNGGKIHKISDNIFHLMRGQVFDISGCKIFTMGGACSHDKVYRVEGKSWWEREVPSNDEFNEGVENLKKHNWEVDYVMTHTAPKSVVKDFAPYFETGPVESYLEIVAQDLKFKHWYFGHYHYDFKLSDKFSAIFYDIKKIKMP